VDFSTRRGFLNVAALFEGGTLLFGLGLGWAAGVLPETPLLLRWQDLLWGLAAVLPMLVGLAFATDIRREVADLLGRSLSACRWYDLAALALLAGLGEELLFRGVLQPWIARWNPWGALVLVNLLFGAAHALTPLYFVFATTVGLYFSWLFTGLPSPGLGLDPPNLLRPIVAHAVYDFIAFVLIIRDYRRDSSGDNRSADSP
jgi:membrane protease YdiL (CAAX protease family)